MTYLITQFFLFFAQAQVILPLILISYFFWDRKLVTQATSLLFLSMLVNSFLKGWMQLPQTYEAGRTLLSFPSGHMQAALALYGWVAYRTENSRLRSSLGVLLLGLAWALVQTGMHGWLEIMGAVGFFVPLLFAYALLLRYEEVDPKRNEPFVLFGLLGFGTVALLALKQQGTLHPHVFVAYYGLVGLLSGTKWVGDLSHLSLNFMEKCVAFLLAATGIGILEMTFKLFFKQTYMPLFQLQWLLMGAWIPFTLKILSAIKSKQTGYNPVLPQRQA